MSKVNKDATKHLKDKIFNDEDWAEVTHKPLPNDLLKYKVNKDISKHLKDNIFEDEDWAEITTPKKGPSNIPASAKDHRQLNHRDAPKQHPMTAIDGLVEALKEKISDSDVTIEKTSEGTILTIGSHTIIIYGDGNRIESISVNGKPIPIVKGNVDINTAGVDVSKSTIKLESSESSAVVELSSIIQLILNEIETIRQDVPEIIFRIWPGMQGVN